MAIKIIINPPKDDTQRVLWEKEVCRLIGRLFKQIEDLEARVEALEPP